MYQYATKSNAKQRTQIIKKNVPQKQGHVIQMCGDITTKSSEDRSYVGAFFNSMKRDNTPQKSMYVYSFVHSDGLGDVGQLKLLHDKVAQKKDPLGLQRIKMLCAFSLTDQIAQRRRLQENPQENIPEEQISQMKTERISKIQNVCGVQSENIKYVGDIPSGVDGQKRIRENAFDTNADWEVEYPVPDPDFMFSGDKAGHLLKIKEMGAANLELSNCKAGDTSFDGIGYGIPDKFEAKNEENEKSAESFLKRLIPRVNTANILNKAWLVSVKNYIGNSRYGNKYAAFSEEKMKAIVNLAKESGAKLVIFAGMPKIQDLVYQTFGWLLNKIHIICSDIDHDTLEDLMAKITDGVIISGGEGLFAESLASPDPKTASVLAARYGFQYQETAYSLLANDGQRYKLTFTDENEEDRIIVMNRYRILFIANKFYYMENKDNFIEILEDSIIKKPTVYEDLKGKEVFFSRNLSALWLPLSINSSLKIQKPEILHSTNDTLAVFREQKKRLTSSSWFSLIDQAISELPAQQSPP